jgi:hypothetical protein
MSLEHVSDDNDACDGSLPADVEVVVMSSQLTTRVLPVPLGGERRDHMTPAPPLLHPRPCFPRFAKG